MERGSLWAQSPNICGQKWKPKVRAWLCTSLMAQVNIWPRYIEMNSEYRCFSASGDGSGRQKMWTTHCVASKCWLLIQPGPRTLWGEIQESWCSWKVLLCVTEPQFPYFALDSTTFLKQYRQYSGWEWEALPLSGCMSWNYWTLSFSFIKCKMGIVTSTSKSCCRIA